MWLEGNPNTIRSVDVIMLLDNVNLSNPAQSVGGTRKEKAPR